MLKMGKTDAGFGVSPTVPSRGLSLALTFSRHCPSSQLTCCATGTSVQASKVYRELVSGSLFLLDLQTPESQEICDPAWEAPGTSRLAGISTSGRARARENDASVFPPALNLQLLQDIED